MDKAKIGIILGSASDLPHARKIGDVLNELDVAFEVTIASAHRTPDDAANYAKNARSRGLERSSPLPVSRLHFPAPLPHRQRSPSSAYPSNPDRCSAWTHCSPPP